MELVSRREDVTFVEEQFSLSERRAFLTPPFCRVHEKGTPTGG